MQLKISTLGDSAHDDMATCLDWINSETIYSCGNDHKLVKWSLTSKNIEIVAELTTIFPLDVHCLHKLGNASAKQVEIILVAATDGKFYLLNRNGRVEKSQEAHVGAVFVGRWSYNNSGFLTAGEDGQIKIWSKSGMLRSTLVTSDVPVYSAAWSFDNQSVVYTIGRVLCIKSLAPNTKPTRWTAHDGLILTVAWCPTNNFIISGAEDCRYKVWDALGRSVYTSGQHDHPISSLAWSPDGEQFAVGSFNTLRVCDFTGWSQCLTKLNSGSLQKLVWSTDGTQLAAACASGEVIFAHLINRQLEWKNHIAEVTERTSIKVTDMENEITEQLDLPDRVIHMSFNYDRLVVTTSSHCYIYATTNWNTPIVFDLKEGAVCVLMMSEKNLLIVEKSSLAIYNYQGRVLMTPKWPGMNPQGISRTCISISNDMLAVRDQNDHKVIHVFDLTGNRAGQEQSQQMLHNVSVNELALSLCGTINERQLAIVDGNKDLFIVQCKAFGSRSFKKIASQIHSIKWNIDANMLATMQDTNLVIFYSPIANNPKLLRLASLERNENDLSTNTIVTSFHGCFIRVRRSDGSLISVYISPYTLALHASVLNQKWTGALALCRAVQETFLWATLACLAIRARNLSVAEEAFSAVGFFDKVEYIQRVKVMANKTSQLAFATLLGGDTNEAESIFLHNGMVSEAISMLLDLYKWQRAFDLAIKHKIGVDLVLNRRKDYLEALGATENMKIFLEQQTL